MLFYPLKAIPRFLQQKLPQQSSWNLFDRNLYICHVLIIYILGTLLVNYKSTLNTSINLHLKEETMSTVLRIRSRSCWQVQSGPGYRSTLRVGTKRLPLLLLWIIYQLYGYSYLYWQIPKKIWSIFFSSKLNLKPKEQISSYLKQRCQPLPGALNW